MNTILVIGASGQIGRKVCHSLLQQDFIVRALVQDSRFAEEFNHPALETSVINLENDFSEAFGGVNKVVFVAGSGPETGYDQTLLTDLWSVKRAIDFAEEEPTVDHFILLSAYGADDPEEEITTDIKPYIIAKHIADEYLTCSSLPYTILRPCKLNNNIPSSSCSTHRPVSIADASIATADVAEVICYCVTSESSKVKILELFNGNTPIKSIFP